MLEHVTREITVEALPAEIPEVLHADVSEMVIGDTIQLSALTPPSGAKFVVDDPEETTIATLSPPRVEEEPEPELEEEAELVGEEGEEVPEGEERPEGEEVPEGESAEGEGGGDHELLRRFHELAPPPFEPGPDRSRRVSDPSRRRSGPARGARARTRRGRAVRRLRPRRRGRR